MAELQFFVGADGLTTSASAKLRAALYDRLTSLQIGDKFKHVFSSVRTFFVRHISATLKE
jgi:hypothetical protein